MLRLLALIVCLVLLAAGAAGCSKTPPSTPPSSQSKTAGTEEHHSHDSGPHGGTIADWGGGTYHVEFTVDHERQEAAVYVLGDDAKSSAPVSAERLTLSINEPPFELELLPQPLEGEADGKASRFVGQDERLGIVREFTGTISGVVDGVPYAGDFAEHAHAH